MDGPRSDVPAIRKEPRSGEPEPVLADYEAERARFSWDDARGEIDGLPGGGINIAYEAIDRHVAHGNSEMRAMRWLGKDGTVLDLSYGDLAERTARFANVLTGLGLEKGARVFTLLGRVPELYVTVLGTLKAGMVLSPLFSAFGPEPIKTRMVIGDGDVLVTTRALYRKKVEPWRQAEGLPRHVILVDAADDLPEETLSWRDLMAAASDRFEIAATAADDPALLHFTSGTTGKPKGALHVHEAVVAHHLTGKWALDLHGGDIVWCTADPGWVTGTSYGIIAPLTNGTTLLVDEAEFDAERWYATLAREKVTVWYTAPTAIRMLMKVGAEAARGHNLSALRFMASVGEPLGADAVLWSQEVFGRPFHDNWWQTETGAIMIANFAACDVKPGSMGLPMPGIEAAIVARDGDDIRVLEEPMTTGELALKTGWPSMFRTYLNEDERYRNCFAGSWYLTGDLAMRDAEGYFWFVGRADDVIKSAGHLIGPFEVESALTAHEAVSDAAVIGVPDERAGEVVKAFVTLHQGREPDDATRRDLMGHARKMLGPAVAPRTIEFVDSLPKTRSGKILRRLIKARELGLPEGDTSTLETAA